MKVDGTMLSTKEFGLPRVLGNRLKSIERLDSTMLENPAQTVYKKTIWSGKGIGSVAILFLPPGAKIKKHQHTNDMELYIAWNKLEKFLKAETCKKGCYHDLINTSQKRWAWVLSIKFDMPQEE